MTRVLIVDDDPSQLRLLARVFTAKQPELSVITASSGQDAIVQLRGMPVDVVLTDLQMPDTNGFGLVTWLLAHQPHVQVFTMTAYPDDDAVERLRALGSVECYTKPLDVGQVLARLSDSLKQGMRGHLRNIGLPSLLQLIAMERKTCTLTVESEGRLGAIYLQDGVLVDARYAEQSGEPAAIQISGWPSPDITIINTCATKQRTVNAPLSFIIMEAVRLADEATRGRPDSVTQEPVEITFDLGPGTHGMGSDSHLTLRSISHFPLRKPEYAEAIAIVEYETGRIRAAAGGYPALKELAQLVARIFSKEANAVGRLGMDDAVEELVLTTERYWTMTRPLPTEPPSLAMVVFNPERANIVLERVELDGVIASLAAWSLRTS